jgi:Lrp/AsnC family leucine-responsive transcriptional regulator
VEETDTIVRLLAAGGRMSFTDQEGHGMSTSAVHQRVKRLEKRGVITGYGAGVDHEELGLARPPSSRSPFDRPSPTTTPRTSGTSRRSSRLVGRRGEHYILKVRVATPSASSG